MSRSKLMLAMMFFCLTTAAPVLGDQSLILHYTFDESGTTTKDRGTYGNDGTIKNAQFMDEVQGRKGVVRLDGSSHIARGDVAPAPFDGDITIEMWVRSNDPQAHKLQHDNGELIKWGSALRWYGPRSPLIAYSRGQSTMRTYLDKEGDLLREQWSHLALVIEYPRIRLYRDGVLFCNKYMPMPGITQGGQTKPIVIGQNCKLDLDELRIYRRALSEAEITAHAHGKVSTPTSSAELFVEPQWYEDAVALRLSCKGSDYRDHMAQLTLWQNDGQEAVAPQTIALAPVHDGSDRYVATATFPIANLEGKSLDAVAHLLGSDGRPTETLYQHAFLKKPKWVHNGEGYYDGVLPPWTPLEVIQGQGSVEVGIWGRRYVFGPNLLPQQIVTKDEQVLAAPITLTGKADGQELAWSEASVKLKKASKTVASLEQIGRNDRATLKINTSIEYDGYAIFDCQFEARRDMTLERLTVEIPLQTRFAKLCFGSNVYTQQTDPYIPMSKLHMGAVDKDLSFRFSPSVWLGDQERGLTWQAESNEDWRYANPERALEVLPRGKTTYFRAHLINVPTKLIAGQTLRYQFALLATPVKPLLRDSWDLRIVRSDPYTDDMTNPDLNLPDRWISLNHTKKDRIFSLRVDELNLMEGGPGRIPALQFYRQAGIRHLWINASDNWPWPLPFEKQYSSRLRRLINAAHAHDLKIYSYLIHERMPTNVPEFDLNGYHMVNQPIKPYKGTVGFCPKSLAVQDAIVYNFARRLDEYGDDGVYLDGTAVHMKSCKNLAHGCGYHARHGAVHITGAVPFDQTDRGTGDAKGPIHPTYSVFTGRKFLRRIYTVVKQRRPEGVIDIHSWYYNPGGLAYGDMLWTGEQWYHLRGKGVDYVADELTLDMFQTAFTGAQIGIACETLPYRLIGKDKSNSQVAATSLLHDIPVRVRVQDTAYFDIMSTLWKVRDRFGIKEAQKLFYWDNADYVQVHPDKCYATLFKHPSNGVLAFVSNLRRDAQAVNVRFNLDQLDLAGKNLDVIDVLSGEPITMTTDGQLTVPLESERGSYVWLQPAGH